MVFIHIESTDQAGLGIHGCQHRRRPFGKWGRLIHTTTVSGPGFPHLHLKGVVRNGVIGLTAFFVRVFQKPEQRGVHLPGRGQLSAEKKLGRLFEKRFQLIRLIFRKGIGKLVVVVVVVLRSAAPFFLIVILVVGTVFY